MARRSEHDAAGGGARLGLVAALLSAALWTALVVAVAPVLVVGMLLAAAVAVRRGMRRAIGRLRRSRPSHATAGRPLADAPPTPAAARG